MFRRMLRTACCTMLLLCAGTSLAAPQAQLWARWQSHDPLSNREVDHSTWNSLLTAYVRRVEDGSTRFAYAAVTPADRARLDDYIGMLASTPVSALDRDQQYALWANLYNALTVRVVLDHFPVRTIRDIDISPGFFADGPWGAKLVEIEGESVSLDDIEHRILRPLWADPRTHYALNCASIGCPDLAPEAFTAANRERLLDAGARAYANSPRGVRLEADGRVVASSIYDWFEVDFGGSERAVLDHLAGFAEPSLAVRLRAAGGIAGYDYDWSLNDAGR